MSCTFCSSYESDSSAELDSLSDDGIAGFEFMNLSFRDWVDCGLRGLRGLCGARLIAEVKFRGRKHKDMVRQTISHACVID